MLREQGYKHLCCAALLQTECTFILDKQDLFLKKPCKQCHLPLLFVVEMLFRKCWFVGTRVPVVFYGSKTLIFSTSCCFLPTKTRFVSLK